MLVDPYQIMWRGKGFHQSEKDLQVFEPIDGPLTLKASKHFGENMDITHVPRGLAQESRIYSNLFRKYAISLNMSNISRQECSNKILA